jgi:hypothetical protein
MKEEVRKGKTCVTSAEVTHMTTTAAMSSKPALYFQFIEKKGAGSSLLCFGQIPKRKPITIPVGGRANQSENKAGQIQRGERLGFLQRAI